MNKKFNLWMTSIEDRYLEEAAEAPKKNRTHRMITLAVAACLVLAATGLLFRYVRLQENPPEDTQQFAENNTAVPSSAPDITPDDDITREYFAQDGTNYTVLSCQTEAEQDISGMEAADAEPLVWYAGGLELKLCSTNDACWVSWYDVNTKTQWCVTSDASSLALLTTAKDIVEELGYNVAVAPEGAADITYNAFSLEGLTVAETTFLLDGIRYSYRMASTYEVTTPFADISGSGTDYGTHLTTEVGWCPAELYYTENGTGKIIWFDIVPGLLYSLSMEDDASEEALLSLAHSLFAPAQDEADW